MTAGVKQSLVSQRGGGCSGNHSTQTHQLLCPPAGIFHVEMGKATKPNMHAMLKLVTLWSP